MSLNDIASKIDAAIEEVGGIAESREAELEERSSTKAAHSIVGYVLEAAEIGTDPFELGRTMVQGAVIGEDEADVELASPVVAFLESVFSGAVSVIQERYGSDPVVPHDDPVAHAVQYMLLHNTWPDGCPSSVIARATAALAAGQRGSSHGSSNGTFL